MHFFNNRNRYLTKASRIALGTAAASIVLTGQAYAQESAEAEADGGEIIVTARKVQENIQDVPISITAFSAETFEDAGLTEFAEIANLTPNFRVQPRATVGSTFANVTIRGQSGGFLTLNADQAVGINVNGAPITRGTSLFTNMFDIEQIEILKGPQGTLFGKNTTGGVVNVTTKAPELDSFGGYAQVTLGEFDRTDGELVLNIPLQEDAVALRVGGARYKRDGFGQGGVGDTLLTGNELSDDDEYFLRGSLLIAPDDRFSLRINADYHKVDEGMNIFRSLIDSILDLGFIVIPINPLSTNPDIYVGSDFDKGRVPQNKANETNINATFNADLGGGIELTSITSYRNQDSNLIATYSALTDIVLGQSSDLWAQELRLAGPAFDDRLNWQVGAFYSFEEGTDIDNLIDNAGGDSDTEAENESISVFGQGTFAVSDAMNVTAGIRYTDEQREVVGIASTNLGQQAQASFDGVSWLLSVDYRFSDAVLTYASVSRGFRSGAIDQDDIGTIVQPEFVTSYEVGLKSDLLDETVRFNVSGYYQDYTDIQVTAFDPTDPNAIPPTTILRNAASATIWGFEGELNAEPIPGFSFGGTVGYTNAEYDEFIDLDPMGNPFDRTDEPIGGPAWQFSANTRYETDISDNVTVGAQLNYFRTGRETLASPAVAAVVEARAAGTSFLPAYDLVNAQIDFNIEELGGIDNVKVSLFAKNLLDKEYFVSGTALDLLGGISTRIVGEPQQFGVRVRTDF